MTKAKSNPVFLERTLDTMSSNGVNLLQAVEVPHSAGRATMLFFETGTAQEAIEAGDDVDIPVRRSVSEAPILGCIDKGDSPNLAMRFCGAPVEIEVSPSETDLFEGLNTLVAVHNGEDVSVIVDWLNYHTQHHGAEAALIVSQVHPKKAPAFAKKLGKAATKIELLKRLVLVTSDIPLGKRNLPAEAHPFNVPGAPGKDRMEIPPPDPWNAPLGEHQIYELLRARFLNTAKAVANLDVHDLLTPQPGPNIFQRAQDAASGCIQLSGSQCYPWRVRDVNKIGYGDHLCVQFDSSSVRRRWCVAPGKASRQSVWRLIRVVGAEPAAGDEAPFYRYMALRHPTDSVSTIVPKSSLIEDAALLEFVHDYFGHNPVRMPEEELDEDAIQLGRTAIVTTMKNEGPFILEWIAYHRAIGVDDFLVYTNDCTDGTDTMLQLLQEKGYVQHRDNPFEEMKLKPQHAALAAADHEPMMQAADWKICMDVDEFICIHTGNGRLEDLFDAVPDANFISITWRLYGNSDIHEFRDELITEKFTRCAPKMARKPHQAWGFKTLFRNLGIFKKFGVHRPKGLKPQLWEQINWVNGSGKPMPHTMFRNAWRSTASTVGYDLVSLNHYAVRSAESFLVKRDRGRVNHVDRDQGLAYWFRMNNNYEEDTSIHRMLPALREELDQMLADPDIAAAHAYSVTKHREKIDELRATENYAKFYEELTGHRMQTLSRMHLQFGANVFLAGPEVVPDEVIEQGPDDKAFFTVEKQETNH